MPSNYKKYVFDIYKDLKSESGRKIKKNSSIIESKPTVKKKTELDKIKEELDESPIISLIDEIMESDVHAS